MMNSDYEDAKKLLTNLVAIPSVNPAIVEFSPDGEKISGEAKVAHFIANWSKTSGLDFELLEIASNRPCVIINVPATIDPANAPTVAFFAHQDTVWVPEIENPFELDFKGDIAYGLGACDDKGSICAGMLAALELKNIPERSANYAFVGTIDEESGFTGIKALVPERLKPDVAIIGEGTGLDLVIAHKGVIRWQVVCRGQSVHASLIPQGKSAIFAAAKLALQVETHCEELLATHTHPLLGFRTINVGMIKGGIQPNSVPDYCEFEVERRLLPGENLESVEKSLREALDEAKQEYELTPPTFEAPPFEIDEDHPWIEFLKSEIRKIAPEAGIRGMTAATEAAHTALNGIPSVVFGPGQIQHAHSIIEQVNINEIVSSKNALAKIVSNFKG